MTQDDTEELAAWLEDRWVRDCRLEALSGDVSHRRYYRVETETSAPAAILVAYPDASKAVCQRFAETTRLLESAGVRVPEILVSDCDRGLMVVEDLGSSTLYERATSGWRDLEPYLDTAIHYLHRLQTIPIAEVEALNPRLDELLLRRELDQTWSLILRQPQLSGDAPERDRLRAVTEAVCATLGDGPVEISHRDYMARNLIPLDEISALGVLDHQDLRLGPRGYDLASLLNDSLVAGPQIELHALSLCYPLDEDRKRYHRAAAQRMLKIVGTFVAFASRGTVGSNRYVPLIAPALARAADHLGSLPEGSELPPKLFERWKDPQTAAWIDSFVASLADGDGQTVC